MIFYDEIKIKRSRVIKIILIINLQKKVIENLIIFVPIHIIKTMKPTFPDLNLGFYPAIFLEVTYPNIPTS